MVIVKHVPSVPVGSVGEVETALSSWTDKWQGAMRLTNTDLKFATLAGVFCDLGWKPLFKWF